jgi:hypothetical protein
VPAVVGVPDMVSVEALIAPPVPVSPDTESPGGMVPDTRNDAGGVCAPVTVRATGVIAVPAVARSGLATDALSCVAPASECSAPSDATAVRTLRSTCPTGEPTKADSAAVATRSTGVRCNTATRIAAGRLSHARRRWRARANFIEKNVRRSAERTRTPNPGTH